MAGTGIAHRTILAHSWTAFAAEIAQAEADGWRVVSFQIAPKDSRDDTKGMTVYGVISKGQA